MKICELRITKLQFARLTQIKISLRIKLAQARQTWHSNFTKEGCAPTMEPHFKQEVPLKKATPLPYFTPLWPGLRCKFRGHSVEASC